MEPWVGVLHTGSVNKKHCYFFQPSSDGHNECVFPTFVQFTEPKAEKSENRTTQVLSASCNIHNDFLTFSKSVVLAALTYFKEADAPEADLREFFPASETPSRPLTGRSEKQAITA